MKNRSKKKWLIILIILAIFQYSCHSQAKEKIPINQARLNQIKEMMPDSLKYLLPKLDSDFKNSPNSKFPGVDYFSKFVPDTLKYLIPILDTVFEDDQRYRENTDLELLVNHKIEVKYLDSINLKIIIPIVDRYGILGFKEIGMKGNNAILMVLQHASSSIHLKYLPLVEEAFTDKKINPGQYSIYVDRTALGQGKMQLYGTQVFIQSKGKGELKPVFDIDNLNKRRDSIGLGPIENYLKIWDIKWDIVRYKKDLPLLKEKYNIN